MTTRARKAHRILARRLAAETRIVRIEALFLLQRFLAAEGASDRP
ncbi:MAG: hypothetical protein PVH47_04310 [Thiohalocapsa sp.]|jgi:hypothetical protein